MLKQKNALNFHLQKELVVQLQNWPSQIHFHSNGEKWRKNSRFWHNRQISANLCIFPNFLFRRHGHIFQRKLVLSFSLTHKLLIFYVCEVASIFVHSRLREKRIFWGGEITPPRQKSVVSEAGINRVNNFVSHPTQGVQLC